MWKIIMYDFSTQMYHPQVVSGDYSEACEYARKLEMSDPDLMFHSIVPA